MKGELKEGVSFLTLAIDPESHEGRIERRELLDCECALYAENLMKGELKVPLKERGGPDLDGPVNLP